MSDLVPIGIAAIVVMVIVLLLARTPRQLNSWSALDKGIDPTEDQRL